MTMKLQMIGSLVCFSAFDQSPVQFAELVLLDITTSIEGLIFIDSGLTE